MNDRRAGAGQVLVAALGGALASAGTVTLLFLVVGTLLSPGLGVLFGFIAFVVAVPVTLAHALLLALPPYFALRRHLPLTRRSAALAGFVIGAVPIALGSYSPPGAPDAQYPGLVARTYAAMSFGVVGAIGRLAFACLLRRQTCDVEEPTL